MEGNCDASLTVNGVNSDHGDVVWDEETTDGELTPEEMHKIFRRERILPTLLGQEIMENTLIVYEISYLYQEGFTADDNRLGRIIQDKLVCFQSNDTETKPTNG